MNEMRSKMTSCKRGLAKTAGMAWILVALACFLVAAAAFGQNKGKGGGKGGGGGGEPLADPAIAVKGLTVMNDDGSNKTEVFSEEGKFSAQPRMPSWSPDGGSIAFTRVNLTNVNGSQNFELWRIDVAVVDGVPQGSNFTKLLDRALHPAWSPLGNEIAFAEGRTSNPPSSLFAIPANGGTPGELYAAPEGHAVFWPAWSPDALRLAFVEMELDAQGVQSIKTSIKILDVASGAVVTTVFAVGAEYVIEFLDWARTQDKLAFDLAPTGFGPSVVFTLDITTGELVRVGEGFAPTWSPDDTRLAYNDSTGKVSTVDLATGDITKLTKGGRGAALGPDWRRF